ncbi:MAG TPA: hypothetical protein VEK57_14665 [Thermoanaerobaculia bacterium]|nr:hypothetical protein [Thermoanaerobaculia bacterium]
MQEFRTRPRFWRLSLVSGAQILVAAWVAILLSLTLQGVADRKQLPLISAGAILLALFVRWLWPSGPSLAARMAVHNVAACVAAFGAVQVVERDRYHAAASAALALLVCVAFWRRQLALLGNVFDLGRLVIRLGVTLAAVLPPLAVICIVALRAWEYTPVWSAGVLAAAALLAALFPPPAKFEQLTRIELREPVAPLLITLAVVATLTAAWPDLIRYGIPLHRVMSMREISP